MPAPPPDRRTWVEHVTGSGVVAWRRTPAGGRREGVLVDIEDATGGIRELYLAIETSRRVAGDAEPRLRLEAAIFRRLAAAGVPVPEMIALAPDGDALLMTRVPGTAHFAGIRDAGTARAVAEDFIDCLARVHAISGPAAALPELGPQRRAAEHVTELLESWGRILRADGPVRDPVLEFAARWLRANIPVVDRPVALVQGDTGPGNFLFEDARVTAVLDWELAHWGDPQEDLGWLSMRAAQEPLPDFPALLRRYERQTGVALDLAAIRYYRVLAEWIVAVIGHVKPRHGLGDTERGNAFVYEQLHRRLTVEAIVDARDSSRTTDDDLPEVVLPEAPDTARTWLYDMAADQVREGVLPRMDDALGLRRAKGVARTVRALRELDRYRDVLEAVLQEAACAALGREVTPAERVTALCDALTAGLPDDRALRYAWLDVQATTVVLRPAMGRLAGTHLAPLPEQTAAPTAGPFPGSPGAGRDRRSPAPD